MHVWESLDGRGIGSHGLGRCDSDAGHVVPDAVRLEAQLHAGFVGLDAGDLDEPRVVVTHGERTHRFALQVVLVESYVPTQAGNRRNDGQHCDDGHRDRHPAAVVNGGPIGASAGFYRSLRPRCVTSRNNSKLVVTSRGGGYPCDRHRRFPSWSTFPP